MRLIQLNLLILFFVVIVSCQTTKTTKKTTTKTTTKTPTKTTTKSKKDNTSYKLQSAPPTKSFEEFKKEFGKQYEQQSGPTTKSSGPVKSSSISEADAIKNYKKSCDKINAHNANTSRTFNMKAYSHSDMSDEEYKRTYTGLVPSSATNEKKTADKKVKSSGKSSTPFDPKKYGFDTSSANATFTKFAYMGNMDLSANMPPAKNQGQCGSCWAFATVALLDYESFKSGASESFSEQFLIDCDTAKNSGCNGGDPLGGLRYAIATGVGLDSNYPYQAASTGTCNLIDPLTQISNACHYKANNGIVGETVMFQLLNRYKNPIQVGIATVGSKFPNYAGGIFEDATCSTDMAKMDHAVVVVGYGMDASNSAFWIVRNSWGTSWGENGYIRMALLKNVCGIGNRLVFICPL